MWGHNPTEEVKSIPPVNVKQPMNHEEFMKKFIESELKVEVSSADSEISPPTTIKEILRVAKEKDQTVVFTFTPGPFKPDDKLPEHWKTTPLANGCTPQLCAFQNALDPKIQQLVKLENTVVYNVNKHPASYHRGKDGLLSKKDFKKLFMLSGEFAKEFNLDTVPVDGNEYLARFSVVVKPNGESAIFTLASPVNPVTAAEHVEKINNFISPVKKIDPSLNTGLSAGK